MHMQVDRCFRPRPSTASTLGFRVSPQICRAHRAVSRQSRVFVLAFRVWHLGVESLDLFDMSSHSVFPSPRTTLPLGLCDSIDPQLVRHVSSIWFLLWLTSIKPNRRAWYYGSRNSQDVAIASSHRLATSPPDSVLRKASNSRRRQREGGRSFVHKNQQAIAFNTRKQPAHPMPWGGDSKAFQTCPLNLNRVSTIGVFTIGPSSTRYLRASQSMITQFKNWKPSTTWSLRCQAFHYHALFEGAVKVALSVPYQSRDEDPQIPTDPDLTLVMFYEIRGLKKSMSDNEFIADLQRGKFFGSR